MKLKKPALIFSKVLFKISEEDGTLNNTLSDLILLKKAVNSEPQFRLFFQAKRISSLQKFEVLTKVFGNDFNSSILELISQLSGPESVKTLNEFSSSFEKLVKDHRNIINVKAIVAEELMKEEMSKLSSTLKSVLGEEINLKVEVDTRIIGGIKLRVEDVFLDGSINYQLQSLRTKLLQI
tara:strand:+ start:22 stop:561 length:540 start_codon:yes stop_codon:yes gene_type:complete